MFIEFSKALANIDNIDYFEVMTPRHANNTTGKFLLIGVKILKGCKFIPDTIVEDTLHKYTLCEAESNAEIDAIWQQLTASIKSQCISKYVMPPS
ncbi:MAG: hypothetical protein OXP71_03200 [Candidatus Poribacteria bacterium]|nr:hypothetical protein [Candidatus Poribacteria bacterium]